MPSYNTLHDDYVSSKKKPTTYKTVALALGCLMVLGVLLAIVVMEIPTAPINATLITEPDDNSSSMDECRITLVESIPLYVEYDANATRGIPLAEAWNELLSLTTQTIDVASFYWTLTGEDIQVNSSTDRPGREILDQFEALPSRNVSVRLLTSIPSVHTHSTDLKVLKKKGVKVRKVNFGRLTGGVLHSKFWIVDMRHVFIGSANMDWRSLTQVKELGVVIYNCSSLAEDLHKIFESYWVMGQANSSLPQPWPPKYDTTINKQHPLVVKSGNVSSHIYLSASPPVFCPPSRTQDLEAVLSIISDARRYIYVAVMDYYPATIFTHPKRYWPALDDALRRAAFEQQVDVRLLVSCGRDSNPGMLPFLQSLASMQYPDLNLSVQIKIFVVPVGNQTDIPYTRVNHNKYMVTDKVAYIGTSNWSGDYFSNTAGVGLVISQHGPHRPQRDRTLHAELRAVFERDWSSQFTVDLADLHNTSDCTMLKG